MVAVLAVIGIYLMSQIKVGNPVEGSNLLKESSDFNTAVRAVNAHFPGLMTLEIVFEGKEIHHRSRKRFHLIPHMNNHEVDGVLRNSE